METEETDVGVWQYLGFFVRIADRVRVFVCEV